MAARIGGIAKRGSSGTYWRVVASKQKKMRTRGHEYIVCRAGKGHSQEKMDLARQQIVSAYKRGWPKITGGDTAKRVDLIHALIKKRVVTAITNPRALYTMMCKLERNGQIPLIEDIRRQVQKKEKRKKRKKKK